MHHAVAAARAWGRPSTNYQSSHDSVDLSCRTSCGNCYTKCKTHCADAHKLMCYSACAMQCVIFLDKNLDCFFHKSSDNMHFVVFEGANLYLLLLLLVCWLAYVWETASWRVLVDTSSSECRRKGEQCIRVMCVNRHEGCWTLQKERNYDTYRKKGPLEAAE